MDLILGQPLGLWALLGVPVVLLIHLLQHEARHHTITTLFLVDPISMDGREGRLLDRIRSSLQMWLQLLAVLLLTWLLVQPRWMKEDSFQRVVIVLDESASMSAFRGRVEEALRDGLPAFESRAAFTEWTLLGSSPETRTLYSGGELEGLFRALPEWRPVLGEHDVGPVLRVAQGLAEQSGVVLLVSDHSRDDSMTGIQSLLVGEPVDNWGFTGLRTQKENGKPTWRAVVRNYSDRADQRTWWLDVGGQASEKKRIQLDPGASTVLSGSFPEDASQLSLRLSEDAFALDDVLPLVRPVAKRLGLAVVVDPALRPLVNRVVGTLAAIDSVVPGRTPDVEILSFPGTAIPTPPSPSICICEPLSGGGLKPDGLVLAERHPLVEGLAWGGLLVSEMANVALGETDDVLVWQGDRPLVVLRTRKGIRQLIVGFDVVHSNAAQQPAFVLLLHRFVESVRDDTRGRMAQNVELRQRLPVAVEANPDPLRWVVLGRKAETLDIPASRASLLRAPGEPGHFQVWQGRFLLLEGAAHFADVREADFSACLSRSELDAVLERIQVRNSRPDPLLPLWMVVLGGVMLWSWYEGERRG